MQAALALCLDLMHPEIRLIIICKNRAAVANVNKPEHIIFVMHEKLNAAHIHARRKHYY